MEFFPANRACRKSVSFSSMIVCCRRKFGACPGTREPKRKKCFAMETWKLDGAKGVADFCSSGLYCFCILNAFWLSTGGGPRQLFCKKFTFASQCRHIVDIRIENFDLHGVLWSQGTPEEGRCRLGWLTIWI